MLTRFFLILGYVYLTRNPTVSADGDHPWCYLDEKCSPDKWDGVCKEGRSQSPIDIVPSASLEMRRIAGLSINKDYTAQYPDFFIKNNGHTIQVQLNEETTSPLLLTGDGLPGAFRFSQLHFHWGSKDNIGSEHTIMGKSYPMELHLVHFSDQYVNILEAVAENNPQALAVLGVFFELSPKDNPALNPIIDALVPVLKYHPDPVASHTGALNMSAFFPDVLDIYRYQGSLTTPSCGEKVIWTVFRRPVPISRRQLEAFRKVQDSHGHPLVDNFRPPQPLIGRRVTNTTLQLTQFNYESANEVDIDNNNPTYNTDGDKNAKSTKDKDHSAGEAAAAGKKNSAPIFNSPQSLMLSSLFLIGSYFVVS